MVCISSLLLGKQEDGHIHIIWPFFLYPRHSDFKSQVSEKVYCMGVGCE